MHRGGRTGKIGKLGQAIQRTLRGMWRGNSVESSRSGPGALAEELEGRRMLAISLMSAEFQVQSTRWHQRPGDDLNNGAPGLVSLPSRETAGISIAGDMAEYGTIHGRVFNDRNGDGSFTSGEEGLESVRVFIDDNLNGILDPNEATTVAGPSGTFILDFVDIGMKAVTVVNQFAWTRPVVTANITGTATPVEVELGMRTNEPDSMIVPIGPEFMVNTYTTQDQISGEAALDVFGNFIVTWSSRQDGSQEGVYAQRYSASGVAIGSEFRVNTYTTNFQSDPVVDMSDTGEFTVVWTSEGQDGDNAGIYGRRYGANGTPLGTEFRVNTTTVGRQSSPAIAMSSVGDFVVTWRSSDGDSYGIFAQRYDISGSAVGSEFRVNAYTTSNQQNSNVAMDSDGDFVVVWDSLGQDGSSYGVYARRYSADGEPQGTEFLVNRSTISAQVGPAVAMAATGDFVVAWRSGQGVTVDIYAKRYSDAGDPQGEEFRVNDYTTGIQGNARVAYDAEAGIIITWSGPGQTDPSGAYARRFNAAGLPQGVEWRVNDATASTQVATSVGIGNDGSVLVQWASLTVTLSNWDVFASRYLTAPVPTVHPGQFAWQSSPQRIEFAFSDDVGRFISPSVLSLSNLSNPLLMIGEAIVADYDDEANTAIFTFPTLPNGGALPNGRYRATFVPPNAPAAANQSFEFFFMNGDANHDGRVDIHDLMSLAVNFGSTANLDYSKADFNYDGVVDHVDLGILGMNWQKSLDSLAPALPAAATSAPSRAPTRTSAAVIELVAEPVPTPSPVRSATRVATR